MRCLAVSQLYCQFIELYLKILDFLAVPGVKTSSVTSGETLGLSQPGVKITSGYDSLSLSLSLSLTHTHIPKYVMIPITLELPRF